MSRVQATAARRSLGLRKARGDSGYSTLAWDKGPAPGASLSRASLPRGSSGCSGCHECLDVCGETPRPGREVQAVAGEVHGDALVDKFAEVGPVFEVPGAPVYFVDDEPVGLSPAELLENLGEDRSTPSGGARFLLVPAGYEEAMAGSEIPDLLPLSNEGNALTLARVETLRSARQRPLEN